MSSCLLDFRGVEKQQHAARSDDNLEFFDNYCFMVIVHLSSYQCMQELVKHKRSHMLLSATQASPALSKFPRASTT